MSKYRKLIAAFVGTALLTVEQLTGTDVAGLGEPIVNGIVAVGTLVGVWGLPNDEA